MLDVTEKRMQTLSSAMTKTASIRYLDVQSLSRTSTCCTLSTFSSASDFSCNDEDDEDDEAANAAAEAASYFTLRRNSSPEVYTYVPQPLSTNCRSGTFILYLIPSGKRARALNVARDYLGSLLGYDESHLYPLHCTLTSFFTVTSHENSIGKEAIAANLAQSLLKYISSEFKVECIAEHTSSADAECQELSDHTRVTSSFRSRNSGSGGHTRTLPGKRQLHSETSTTTSPRTSPRDYRSLSSRGRRRRHSRLLGSSLFDQDISIIVIGSKYSSRKRRFSLKHFGAESLGLVHRQKLGIGGTRSDSKRACQALKRACPSQRCISRLSDKLERGNSSDELPVFSNYDSTASVTCSSCLFEIRHKPSKEGVDSTTTASNLRNVFVTKDESVILPMQLNWKHQNDGDDSGPVKTEKTTLAHLKDLCHSLQEHLLPRCVVSMPHRNGSEITAKAASHVALSSSKKRIKCPLPSLMAAARLYDSASLYETDADYWDLALCELESWGSLDDHHSENGHVFAAKTTEGSCRSLTPHVFREILRISKVGVTVD